MLFKSIWLGISAVIALAGGIALHFTFLKAKNEKRFNGFLGWMYDFLTFKKMMLESLLRVLYVIAALFITLSGFVAGNLLSCLLTIVGGNLVLRIAFEFLLILLVICRNTSDINKKLTGDVVKKIENIEASESTIEE